MPISRSSTDLIHSDYSPPAGFGSLSTAIHHASTVTFADVASMRARDWRRKDGYTYGLHGTPTTFTLEERITRLERGNDTLLTPSGLAAIALINLALLKTGDAVLLPDNVYGPSREMGAALLAPLGIRVVHYDPGLGSAVADLITPATRLMWIESPGSITMEVSDLGALVGAAKARGVATAIDNTWSAGLLLRPFEHHVDIVMQALTKYPSGGSDVLMGSVTTQAPGIHEQLKLCHMRLGLGVGGDDAFLILRGLATLPLRLQQHGKNALAVADWLARRPEVAQILHPAFADCPGHEFWKRDFAGSGGLFSFVFKKEVPQERIDALVDALKLFKIGYSWGGAVSLAIPYLMGQTRSAVPWEAGGLVRLYIGLEDPLDLIADLSQGFETLAF